MAGELLEKFTRAPSKFFEFLGMEGEIGSGGYNELRWNRERAAVELETSRDGTGNKARWRRERGAIKGFGAAAEMPMGTTWSHLEKSRFLGYRLGMT